MKKSLMYSLLALLISPNLYAQRSVVKFERISIDQGLSQSYVHCIIQDRKGFMWFGTEDGLNRYDGYNFKIFKHNPGNPHSICSNAIWSMCEDASGIMWLGTVGGLDRFDPGTEQFEHYQNAPDDSNSISNNEIHTICFDDSGMLWIGTLNGLNKFDPKSKKFVRYYATPKNTLGLKDRYVSSIYKDKSGMLWIGTVLGLSKFDIKNEKFIPYQRNPQIPLCLRDNNILSIFEDKSGLLWLGTANGFIKFDREKEEFIHYKNNPDDGNSLSYNIVQFTYEDRLGNFWIGTFGGGLDKFDRRNGDFIHHKNSPYNLNSISSNSVYSVCEDRSGTLWIGAYSGGVNKFALSNGGFVRYKSNPDDPNSLSNNSIRAFWEDKTGIIWVGTRGGGLNRFDRQTEKFFHYKNKPDDPNSLGNDMIQAIYQDKLGDLWIGTYGGGLDRFDIASQKFIHYRHDPDDSLSLSDNVVRSIGEDKFGMIWIATWGNGLNKFDRQTGNFYVYQNNPDDPNSLIHSRVRIIFKDKSGDLWIGTDGGLDKFDYATEKFIHYKIDQEDPISSITYAIFSLFEDTANNFWVGTNGGGLIKLNRETGAFTSFREKDGLPNDVIYGILDDDQGNLWISTNKGISKFDPIKQSFKNYDVRDGLQSNEFNAGASLKTRDGQMFFGGINGFNAFYPGQIIDNPYLPPIVITDFEIFNETVKPGANSPLSKPITETNDIIVSYKDYSFSFEFAALSFSSPEKNQYAYMMEGLDKNWNFVGTQRFANYTGLPAGSYLFRVKGSNNDGVWNEEGTSIKVTIIPPFWRALWFRIILIVIILGSIWGGYKIRISSIHKQKRLLEDLVVERTQELHHEREELKKAHDELEIRVQKRTEELSRANSSLEMEIKERKKAEEERIYLQEQLFHAQKMESIGRLAGGIAHDFNNILTSIMGYAELLKMKFKNTTSEGQAADVILKGTERAADLTSQLLGFARHGKYNPVPLNVNTLICDAVKVTEKIFEKNIKVSYYLEDSIYNIEADQNQINQVLTNLIINARDAMPDGGELSFKTENIYLDKDYMMHYPEFMPGNYVRIAITDSGMGMSDETKQHVFEPFFTTKQKGKGTGLGLAMVYGIIKNHNGHVKYYSEAGKGTTFTLYLPVTEKRVIAKEEKTDLKRGFETILVVDDEVHVREIIKDQLERLGYKTLIASDGVEALNIYKKMKNEIHLILLDMIMPHLSGKETFAELKKINPEVKVLLVSGFSQTEKTKEIIDEGVFGFLQKPFRLNELSSVIYKALNGKKV